MTNSRFVAVEEAYKKAPIVPTAPDKTTSAYYGCKVFNRTTMRKYLSSDTRRMVAEDARRHLSALGFRTLAEAVGRSDMILRKDSEGRRSDTLDISKIVEMNEGTRTYSTGQDDIVKDVLDKRIVADTMHSVESGRKVNLTYSIINVDRSVGTMLSGAITKRGLDLDDGTVNVSFNGTAGQSFGAFLCKGISFELVGQANDFVGKGLSGGKISIFHKDHIPEPNVIAGNTALYGATSGEVYIAGSVGERFCVRNSGAIAVAGVAILIIRKKNSDQ